MTGSTPEVRRYRWVICAMSFFIMFVGQGMFFGGISVFDVQLINALSESTGQEIAKADIKLRDTLMLLMAAVCGLGSGWLADRVGVKPLILVGMSMLAFGNYLLSRVDSLTEMYLIGTGLGLALALCGLMINVYLISSWFDRNRGLAIGIVLAGTSLGNAFFPKLNVWLIQTGGWRSAFEWLAWIALAMVPLAFFFVRNGPMSAGKQAGTKSASVQLGGYTLKEALSSRNFWMLATIAMCTFYSILGMQANVFLYMRESAYEPQVSATAVSILFFGGFVGKLLAGYLAETFGHKLILLSSLGLMLAGAVMLLFAIRLTSAEALWGGLVLFGFGWGGIYTLIQLLSADLFGMRALGKILGVINVLDAFGGALGPFVTAKLADVTGSYFVSFAVMTGLLCVATVAASMLDMRKAAINESSPQPA
ncbi:MAG: MFS transporter [Gammaproteobacteria bacterium]